jgi:hypothetical protein
VARRIFVGKMLIESPPLTLLYWGVDCTCL